MEKYLEGVEPTSTRSSAASARAPSISTFFPTYCGSSFKNKGVQLVLDAVVDYLPNPMEVAAPARDRPRGQPDRQVRDRRPDKPPVRALAFKIMDDRFGSLTFTRIYSGTITKGMALLNTVHGQDASASAAWWRCTPTTAR